MNNFGYSPVLGLTDFPITNMIINGNFAENTSGVPANWTNIGSLANQSVTLDGTLGLNCYSATTAGVSNGKSQNITMINGHKYYISAYLKSGSSKVVGIRLYASGAFKALLFHTASNTWVREKTVYASDGTETKLNLSCESSDSNILNFAGILKVDLTDIFGSGNEPSATEMDALLAYFPTLWFDGTVNLADYKWFMIYLLTRIRTLEIAVAALGGS